MTLPWLLLTLALHLQAWAYDWTDWTLELSDKGFQVGGGR